MADFRKLFLVLAMVAALSVSGYAATFGCVGNPGANKHLRGGGITELLGDVVLTCSGGTVGVHDPTQFTVQISGASTTVTNKLGTYSDAQGAYPISAAAEVLDNNETVIQAVQGYLDTTNPGIVLFPGITLPMGTTSTVRFRNIRVKTDYIASTSAPIGVTATVGTSMGDVPITNSTQAPGLVYPSLKVAVTTCNGGDDPSLSYQQCIAQPPTPGALSFGIRFSENITAGAFKIGAEESGVTVGGPARITAFDGTTFTKDPDITPISDTATYPTRLMARFSNVPEGVSLYVTTREMYKAGNSKLSTAFSKAKLLTKVSTAGELGEDAVGGTVATCEAGMTNGSGAPLTLAKAQQDATTGEWYAVWEVTQDDMGLNDRLVFGVMVEYAAGSAKKSTEAVKVVGEYAPISEVVAAHATASIPRFTKVEETASLGFTIAPCITNLLFPYVTNQQGYETGIAVVNTSKDNVVTDEEAAPKPFGTKEQSGKCNLYLFGSDADGAVADTYTTANEIKAGENWAENLSAIHEGFQGYIIARCDFQYAHGLAFLTLMDNGTASFSEYLALVIPDTTVRNADPFTIAGAGKGEQLGF